MEELSLEALRERFRPFDIRHNPEKYHIDYPEGVLRKASVLIPLFYCDGDYRVILTVRSKDLTHHAANVAFPGGMKDDTDEDEIHTALREAEEEIGLDPKLVDIICVSGPAIVRPNSLVYPVMACVQPDFKLKINEKEVSRVFDLPLSRFLSGEHMHTTDFLWRSGTLYHIYHFIDTINGEEVETWGITAFFCVCTALVLYQSDKKFSFTADVETTKDHVFTNDTTKTLISSFVAAQAKI